MCCVLRRAQWKAVGARRAAAFLIELNSSNSLKCHLYRFYCLICRASLWPLIINASALCWWRVSSPFVVPEQADSPFVHHFAVIYCHLVAFTAQSRDQSKVAISLGTKWSYSRFMAGLGGPARAACRSCCAQPY